MSVTTIIAYLISIAIPIGAVYVIFLFDLFGTGKRSTILTCLGWGAIGAFGLAYLANSLVITIVGYERGETLTGPIIEEILKSAMLFYLITRPRFHYAVDGAVYGFACGIGFAVTENILYVSTYPNQALAVAISRALSTSLMHAATSSLVGISLGYLRRSQFAPPLRLTLALVSLVPAMLTHIVFNNAVYAVDQGQLNSTVLLLLGFAIGLGGAGVIAYLISRTLADEKKRFAQTLGIGVGVSTAERKAVQSSGGEAIEAVLKQLGLFFGEDKIASIRRLLVTQANIGILQNNLSHPTSERLRKAWQEEIDAKRAEINQLRNELGVYVMSFLRGAFPDDAATRDALQQKLAASDPTQVHGFDLFIVASKIAQTVSPEELSQIADLLKQNDLFKDVSLSDLENLSRAITTRHYNDGDLIFDDGDTGDEVYVIVEGAIDVLKIEASGGEKLLNTCTDLVGELTLLDGRERSARARAKGELETYVLRRDQFMMFIQSRPNVILAMLKFLTQRARHVSNIVDTSIAWASEVARGNFANEKQGPAWATAGAPTAPPPSRISSSIKLVNRPDSANVSGDTVVMLRGVFSKVNESLQAREAVAAENSTGPNSPNGPSSRPTTRGSTLFSRFKV